MNNKLRELLAKWRSEEDHLWDAAYLTKKECADDLEAILDEFIPDEANNT